MKIRFPKINDYGDYTKLINSIIDEGEYTALSKKISEEDEKRWLEDILDKIKNKKVLVICAEKDGLIIGHVSVTKGTGANSHIGTLGLIIHPNYRRGGVGSNLLNEALAISKEFINVDIINLQVRKGNDGAQGFYKKLKFLKYGELKNGLIINNKNYDTIFMYKEI